MRRTRLAGALALIVVMALAVSGCGTTTVVSSPDAAMPDTVTAHGQGTALAPPDTAVLTFGATESAPQAETALAAVSKAAEAISAAVREAGVAGEDIQTADVRVYPEYAQSEGEGPRVTGYRASISVRVKVRDLATVGQVISAASDAGSTEISGPMFTLDDDADANAKAIEDAVADARSRAEAMARAGGRSLGSVRTLTETVVSAPPVWGYRAEMGAVPYAADVVPVEPGQLDITAQVTVIFGLE